MDKHDDRLDALANGDNDYFAVDGVFTEDIYEQVLDEAFVRTGLVSEVTPELRDALRMMNLMVEAHAWAMASSVLSHAAINAWNAPGEEYVRVAKLANVPKTIGFDFVDRSRRTSQEANKVAQAVQEAGVMHGMIGVLEKLRGEG